MYSLLQMGIFHGYVSFTGGYWELQSLVVQKKRWESLFDSLGDNDFFTRGSDHHFAAARGMFPHIYTPENYCNMSPKKELF